MELELQGLAETNVEGNVEIMLPSFMMMLPQGTLDTIDAAKTPDAVVAAGLRPMTTEVVFLTADGRLFCLDAAANGLPVGEAAPSGSGELFTINDVLNVPVAWALQRSRLLATVDITDM